jgi:hypothetical protein
MAGAVAIAAALLLVVLIFGLVLALVHVTSRNGRHSTISANAKLYGCGEVRVEVTPLKPTRRAR